MTSMLKPGSIRATLNATEPLNHVGDLCVGTPMLMTAGDWAVQVWSSRDASPGWRWASRIWRCCPCLSNRPQTGCDGRHNREVWVTCQRRLA